MSVDSYPDPWYLTVVRTQGLMFIRPEKSWRPIVSVVLTDTQQTYETILGCDGQNPNLKSPIVLRDVDRSTRLDIRVWHKSHSKKRTKRHKIGSAYVSLDEVLRQQTRPGSDLNLRLSCPTPQKKSPTVAGRQQYSAVLTIRLVPPSSFASSSSIPSPSAHDSEDGGLSDATSWSAPSGSLGTSTIASSEKVLVHDDRPLDIHGAQLKKRRKRRIRGYQIDSDDEDGGSDSYESSNHPSPQDGYFPPFIQDDSQSGGLEQDVEGPRWFAGMMLPRYADQSGVDDSLSLPERFVDVFAPYHELRRATLDSDYEKILGRLLTEWYVVGGSLLALAGIDAAVFGFAPGSLFPIDWLSEHVVAFGAIAAGLGLVFDAWFLVCYSGANAAKFQRQVTDVYGSYFFFCLTCRLPTLCMFLSAVALMVFLLGVAWAAWPAAVLVMSFLAGTLVSLQYLVFGCHRLFNLCVWLVRTLWRVVRGRSTAQDVPAEGCNVPEVREAGVTQ
ncbi:hypothetical protein B0H21DRAFT_828294 [Amylocystis lapponica]|nr:hypothetical protein B0H21DRAFT_828294 [Amylocystis lapponica]